MPDIDPVARIRAAADMAEKLAHDAEYGNNEWYTRDELIADGNMLWAEASLVATLSPSFAGALAGHLRDVADRHREIPAEPEYREAAYCAHCRWAAWPCPDLRSVLPLVEHIENTLGELT